jgi:hypothetical protein
LNADRSGFALAGPLADLVADSQTEANLARFGQGFGSVTDLEFAPNGDLYVVDILNGTIYRIRQPLAPPIPALPPLALLALAATLACALAIRLARAQSQ